MRAHMMKLEDSKAAPKKVFYQYMVKFFFKKQLKQLNCELLVRYVSICLNHVW